MAILVTGCAGFIGFHVCDRLLREGHTVVGLDNLGEAIDIRLKRDRLDGLQKNAEFSFGAVDITNAEELRNITSRWRVEAVIHLAGQAGLRTSFDQAEAHVRDNYLAHLKVLEFCRDRGVRSLVHASTSAVYGVGDSTPMNERDPVANPISIYAATKRGAELLSSAWATQYQLPITSLRFFNVYGPWGRPDSAPWIFAERILSEQPINLHGLGQMRRSFIYIDDIVSGILASMNRPLKSQNDVPSFHAIYNLGGRHPESLEQMVAILEKALGRTAQCTYVEAHPGELIVTDSDIRSAEQDLDFAPIVPLDDGLTRFAHWFKKYHDHP